METKQLPNVEESEVAIIGCMLIDNNIINSINLKTEDFYNQLYFRLYTSIKLIYAEHSKVDIVMIKEFLEKKKVLDKLWWLTFIIELIENTPSSSNYKVYIKLIQEYSNKRKVINIWRKIEDIWFNTDQDSEKILWKVRNLSENIFEIEDNKGYGVVELTDKFVELQERYNKYNWLWYNSAHTLLNTYTQWIIPWTVQTIVAYSNMWKSSFAYSFIPDLLKKEKKVLFLSNEVMSDILFSNILKTYYKKDLKTIMSEDFIFNMEDFKDLRIVDNIFNLDEIKILVENSDSDVVFIDFIQNIQTWLRTEYENMSKVAIELQRLAIKTWKTIFAISQANNESRFSSWDKIQPKWSGNIFASSDIILALSKDWNELKLNILKNKFGKKDINFIVNVDFETLQFELVKEIWDNNINY